MPLITDEFITSMKAVGKNRFYWDSQEIGFGVRMAANGQGSFVLQWRASPGGQTQRRKLASLDEMKADQARQLAANLKTHLISDNADGAKPQSARKQGNGRINIAATDQREHVEAHLGAKARDALAWLQGDIAFTSTGAHIPQDPLRAALLASATEMFLADGYDVSLSRIARRAGVSLPTLYKHFGGKDELFKAAIAEIALEADPALEVEEGASLEKVLLVVAEAYRNYVLRVRSLSLHRLAITDLGKFPEAAMRLLDLTRGMHRLVVERLNAAMDAGTIVRMDPDGVAEAFLEGVIGLERTRRLVGAAPISEAALAKRSRMLVKIFIRGLER